MKVGPSTIFPLNQGVEQVLDGEDVIVVGAGVAGLTAGLYCARAGQSTRIMNCGSSILNRNAHLENYPGFPGGVDPRLLLEMMQDQVDKAGCRIEQAEVLAIEKPNSFCLTAGGTDYQARRVLLTCWPDSSLVEDLAVGVRLQDGKHFIETNEEGETALEGLYAAGRLTGIPHQTVVAAGDGARVALSIIDDLDPAYYHDWVVPEGYFTDRGRAVPRGCEEISDEERHRRDRQARREMIEYMQGDQTGDPVPHPSQREE